MKVKNSVFFLPLLFLIFVSCEGKIPSSSNSGEEVHLNAAIEGPRTLAAGSVWEKGDAIGIYMKKTGQPLTASSSGQNTPYVTQGSSSFLPAKGSSPFTFPADGSQVDFIGYYPYTEDIDNLVYPVDVSNQSVQADIDLLYSDNAQASDASTSAVNMLFSHQLAKIVLTIGHQLQFDMSDMQVMITGAGIKAGFSLADGKLSAPTQYGNIAFRVASDGKLAEAILLPSSDLTGYTLWFVTGNDESYKYPLGGSSGIGFFKKSTLHNYQVTLLSNHTATITQGSISDWLEGPVVTATLDPTTDTPPVVKGSKKDPFTVAEAQTNQNKTAVWVEGYIVGSFDSSIKKFIPGSNGAKETNLALAGTPSETDTSKMLPVELPDGKIRDALGLTDNPDNYKRKVKVRGDLTQYYSAPGIKKTKEYQFTGSE